MEYNDLIAQIDQWHAEEDHQRIVDTIEAMPERDYTLTSLLARAYNNLAKPGDAAYSANLERALELLCSVEREGREDALWYYRAGYAFYYLDREEMALPYFERAAELDPEDPDAPYFAAECRKWIARRQEENHPKGEREDVQLSDGADAFRVTLNLNARFQPQHRHDLEDALGEAMDRLCLGVVDGGGTLLFPSGEVRNCDIELYLQHNDPQTIQCLAELVDSMGIAKGSRLCYENAEGEQEERPVGTLEGMAIYLSGTELPAEVYQKCDINTAIAELGECLEGLGELYSWWEGPKDTALYFYGQSFEAMTAAARDFLETYPLCQKCRVEQIA